MADPPEVVGREGPPVGPAPQGIPPADSEAYRDVTRLGKLRPLGIFNVREFGAVGDGNHDDTSAIQRALDATEGPGRGIVYLPAGVYPIGTELVPPIRTHLLGAGVGSTEIKLNNATMNGINIGAAAVTVEGIRITAGVTKTAGAGILVNDVHNTRISKVQITGQYHGVELVTPTILFMDSFRIENSVGVGILMAGALDVFITHGSMDNSSQPVSAIKVVSCSNATIRDVDSIRGGVNLNIAPGAGQVVASLYIVDCFFDQSSGHGIRLSPTAASGSIVRCRFDGCWASAGGATGILVDANGGLIDGITFNDLHVFDNASQGLLIEEGREIQVRGGFFAGNTNHGIVVAAGVSEFSIQGVRSGASAGFGNNGGSGIAVATGSSDYYTIMGNDCRDNDGTNLSDGGTGGSKIVDHNLT